MKYKAVFLAAAITLSGCAVGQKHNYLDAKPVIPVATKSTIAVGVQDKRPLVLSHEKDSDYVGAMRSGWGIPYNIGTESKKPLADDMASVLEDAIDRAGGKGVALSLDPDESKEEILRQAKASGASKLLLMTLREWYTDTYNSTDLTYNVTLEAWDDKGNVLASKKIKGTDTLGSSFINPPSFAYDAAPKAFQKKVEELMTGDVVKALK